MTNSFLVLQTDFGLGDGAVAAMYGVAYTVDSALTIANLTHEIPAYDIFDGLVKVTNGLGTGPAPL